MKLWLVTPVKPFDESKSRLAAVLSQAERAALSRSLLERTLRLAQDSGRFTGLLVVSRADAALSTADKLISKKSAEGQRASFTKPPRPTARV